MTIGETFLAAGIFSAGVAALGTRRLTRFIRRKRYERGARLKKERRKKLCGDYLRWGNAYLPESLATQHFLAVGTTGSGKTLVQRLLMRRPLSEIIPGADKR